MDYSRLRFSTRQIHAGLDPNPQPGARGVAKYPTAAYRFRTCDYAANLFELSEPGNKNPTSSACEERVAALYGGSYNLFRHSLRRLGIEDVEDIIEDFEQAFSHVE